MLCAGVVVWCYCLCMSLDYNQTIERMHIFLFIVAKGIKIPKMRSDEEFALLCVSVYVVCDRQESVRLLRLCMLLYEQTHITLPNN